MGKSGGEYARNTAVRQPELPGERKDAIIRSVTSWLRGLGLFVSLPVPHHAVD